MKIRNPIVISALEKGDKLRLDLGAGASPLPGYYGVDHSLEYVDIQADLNLPLDRLPDNCVSHMYSRHTLEHIVNITSLMEEIHRLCSNDSIIDIIVPHFSNVYGYSDPTHLRLYGIYSMFYFCDHGMQPRRKVPTHYSKARFSVNGIVIKFYRNTIFDYIIAPIFESTVNHSFACQEFYERRLAHFYHAWEIHFNLRAIK